MLTKSLAVIAVVTLAGTLATAQQPAAPKPAPDPPIRAEQPAGRPTDPTTNFRLELTITDQSGPGESAKKTVSMIVSNGQNGSIRSGGSVTVPGKGTFPVELNVDARPNMNVDNLIQVTIALEYVPKPGSDAAATGEGRSHLNERLSLYVTPGKPMLISQASDPSSERRIAVELTATILK